MGSVLIKQQILGEKKSFNKNTAFIIKDIENCFEIVIRATE